MAVAAWDYFADEVQIGGGGISKVSMMKPLAQHGAIGIKDRILYLLGTDGTVLAEAPVDQVTAKTLTITMGQTAKLELPGGVLYSVSVGWGERLTAKTIVVGGWVRDPKSATKDFINALAYFQTS